MQPILKGGFIMVNTKEMTESLIKELAFSEEELRELKAAKEKPIVFDEEKASKILAEHKIYIDMKLKEGDGEATAWGCDLTYDYVKINGDYRS